jgi:hypothetical protein
MWRLIGVLRS